jgi:oxaloacetate decarboxylase
MSMRAAQDIGFEVAMFGGSVASLVVLGAPDITLVSLSEFAEQTRRICRAGDIPLMVDADHGFGNALNVRRTVEEIEAAGAAALTIEDTLLPAGFDAPGTQLISIREIAGKVRAAVDAKTDPALTVLGRTHAAYAAGVKDLLERQKALQDSGADAVFVTGVKSLAVLDSLAAGATVPLVLGGQPAGVTVAEMAARGVRLCLAGHQAYFEGVSAVHAYLYQQRFGTAPPVLESKVLAEKLSHVELYAQWTKRFLN